MMVMYNSKDLIKLKYMIFRCLFSLCYSREILADSIILCHLQVTETPVTLSHKTQLWFWKWNEKVNISIDTLSKAKKKKKKKKTSCPTHMPSQGLYRWPPASVFSTHILPQLLAALSLPFRAGTWGENEVTEAAACPPTSISLFLFTKRIPVLSWAHCWPTTKRNLLAWLRARRDLVTELWLMRHKRNGEWSALNESSRDGADLSSALPLPQLPGASAAPPDLERSSPWPWARGRHQGPGSSEPGGLFLITLWSHHPFQESPVFWHILCKREINIDLVLPHCSFIYICRQTYPSRVQRASHSLVQ